MAYSEAVKYGNLTFPARFGNRIVFGASELNVKEIHFPGINGVLSLNMKRGGKRIQHSGTIRVPTQLALNSFSGQISSVCDGELRSLSAHSRETTSCYAESVELGAQFKAYGPGATGSVPGAYFGRPFTINYVYLNRG